MGECKAKSLPIEEVMERTKKVVFRAIEEQSNIRNGDIEFEMLINPTTLGFRIREELMKEVSSLELSKLSSRITSELEIPSLEAEAVAIIRDGRITVGYRPY
ncbi:hypothetical protein [Roseibium marinum]|uniref:Uncharacterized protein n=1 Tax=Roseibium marinum TaxID=281252 RepID=A0A2S3V512_9HYPH|nr:hypothetical protein [Roseibium marinum]POF34759.1 hypothetical protein CLV41_1011219 [Roseibium marinum]